MISLCPHTKFSTKCDVEIRDIPPAKGAVIGEILYALEVRISCQQCGIPFQFVGLAAGAAAQRLPTCTGDMVEARLPIRPHQLDLEPNEKDPLIRPA